MTIMDCRPFLAVGVSFLAAVLISFSRKYPNVRESWSVIASFIKFGLILSMVPGVLAGVNYEWTLFQITDIQHFARCRRKGVAPGSPGILSKTYIVYDPRDNNKL